jgi:hypothetical protein
MSDPVSYAPVADEIPQTAQINQVVVSSAGTAVVLGSGVLLVGVIVQALSTNVSSIYIGPTSGVNSSNGYELQPGQATSFVTNGLNDLWINAITSGDGVCYGGS